MMGQLNRLYGMINAERAKASFIDTSTLSNSMRQTGRGSITGPDDRSILDSIGDIFGSISFNGGVPTGMQMSMDSINPTARQLLDTDQQKKIRQHYNEIDIVLK
jgi:hypothetical protein